MRFRKTVINIQFMYAVRKYAIGRFMRKHSCFFFFLFNHHVWGFLYCSVAYMISECLTDLRIVSIFIYTLTLQKLLQKLGRRRLPNDTKVYT